ncbi:MAG: hypothetical protein JO285_16070 [Kutzneria sp.]|nr:hypothetical protein [Kutzneria sp.]
MSSPLDWSLINGPVPVVLVVSALAVLVALLWVRRRTWWTTIVPPCLLIAVLGAVGEKFLIENLYRPFPDALPPLLYAWLGVTVLATSLAIARMRSAAWRGRVLMVAGVVLTVVVAVSQVNVHYGMYVTLRTALARFLDKPTDLASVRGSDSTAVRNTPGTPLEDMWTPPATMPDEGTLSTVTIPSSGGFQPSNAWVYLPPAYLASPRAELPVLVMLSGDPGSTRDWIDGGQLKTTLDDFAHQHHGLAPVVVTADDQGSGGTNPMCMNSRLGQVETYLTTDVPTWIHRNLQVTEDHHRWAVGGLSSGGTCSLQLAVRAPAVYPTFLDFSGQSEPTLGTRQETVDRAFGGDQAAFTKINPMDIMATTRFLGTAGVIGAGRDDGVYEPQQRTVIQAGTAAGMDLRWMDVPGGHSWTVWRELFRQSLPWLASRTELTR